MKLHKSIGSLAALAVWLCVSAFAATSTQVIGTYQDLGGNLVTSGQIIFTLQPPIDAAMAGNSRFSSQSVSCSINGATVGATSAVRSANVTTLAFVGTNPFLAGDVIEVESMADSTMNGTWTVATSVGLAVTYSNPGTNSTSGGGTVSALRNQAATGPCSVVQNTALLPQGTSYKACTYPNQALSGCFTFYATSSQQDLSTTAPLPTQQATYPFVDIFSTQTIAGAKTFSGLTNFLGGFQAGAFTSSSASPALSGVVNLAAGDKACWRNAGNSGDVCIQKNASDQLVIANLVSGEFQSSSANPALTGIVQLASTDKACWRNNANSADVCISKNASDQFVVGTLASPAIASPTTTGTDNGAETLQNKTLDGVSSGNSVTLLNAQGNAGAITGNGAAQNVFSYTLPANTLAAGKGIRIRCFALQGGATNASVVAFNFGAKNVALGTMSAAGVLTGQWEILVFNKAGVTNAQIITAFGFDGASAFNSSDATGAVDTTAPVTITLTFTVASTTTMTPVLFEAELIQ